MLEVASLQVIADAFYLAGPASGSVGYRPRLEAFLKISAFSFLHQQTWESLPAL